MSNPLSSITVSGGRVATYSQGPWFVVLSEYNNGLPSDIVYAGTNQTTATVCAATWANDLDRLIKEEQADACRDAKKKHAALVAAELRKS
jgi:hypothetical protein